MTAASDEDQLKRLVISSPEQRIHLQTAQPDRCSSDTPDHLSLQPDRTHFLHVPGILLLESVVEST